MNAKNTRLVREVRMWMTSDKPRKSVLPDQRKRL